MKQNIAVITDIWGMTGTRWIDQYVYSLERDWHVIIYNTHELGMVDATHLSEKILHEQFINGGIDNAVEKLIKQSPPINAIIGFSIGGLIAWKACLKGLQVESLIALSSTRLRYETEKPHGNIHLIYGQEDPFKPNTNWFDTLDIYADFIEGQGHEVYKNSSIIPHLCQKIKAIL